MAERLKAAVCETESCLSATFDFPRKSFDCFSFSNQLTWLLLAPEAPFWGATGTIAGTVLPCAAAAVNQFVRDAKPMMTSAPITAKLAPMTSVVVGR